MAFLFVKSIILDPNRAEFKSWLNGHLLSPFPCTSRRKSPESEHGPSSVFSLWLMAPAWSGRWGSVLTHCLFKSRPAAWRKSPPSSSCCVWMPRTLLVSLRCSTVAFWIGRIPFFPLAHLHFQTFAVPNGWCVWGSWASLLGSHKATLLSQGNVL